MMTVTPISKSAVSYLTSSACLDYFTVGGNPPGMFHGGGVQELFGQKEFSVQREHLRRLLRGYHPLDPDYALVQHQAGKKHQRGIELCFNDPKSVDTLWSQVDERTRNIIRDSRRAALTKVLDYAEKSYGASRCGKDGTEIRSAKLVFAIFDQYQSREGDPKCHSHVLLANIGIRDDGTTGTILTKPFYTNQKLLGALYRAELAAQLETRIGVRCELHENKFSFTFKGHSQDLDKRFSTRSKRLVEELRTHGSVKAREAAARSTRPAKDERPLSEKVPEWKKIGSEEFGYDPAKVMGHRPRILLEDQRYEFAFRAAIKHLGHSNSHFTERELMEHVAIQAQAKGIGADRIITQFQHSIEKSRDLVALGESHAGRRYTTRHVMALEKKLIRSADRLGVLRHGVRDGIIRKVLRQHSEPKSVLLRELAHHATQLLHAIKKEPTETINRNELVKRSNWVTSVEQRQAVRHLTKKGSGIRVVEGWAGTGKTAMLRVANQIWTRGGYDVVGVACAGKAAEELERGAGITSYTIAAMRLRIKPSLAFQAKDHARQIPKALFRRGCSPRATPRFKFTKKTVLVVDEMSMVNTQDMAFLIRQVQKAKGMIVLCGDRHQLPAIGLGGGGAYLADRFGKVQMEKIQRQVDPLDRRTVMDLGKGNAEAALKDLASRGKVHVASDWDDAKRKLVADWMERERKDRSAAQIYVATNEDRVDLNIRCQQARLQAGELTGKGILTENGEIYVGDRVIFRASSRSIGVRNGYMGTVQGLIPTGVAPIARVTLDSGEKVLVPLASYKGLHRGYVVTAHVGQGTSNTNTYHLLGGLNLAREMGYVQGSRHRQNIWVYTDRYEAGENLERLASLMSRSKAKTLAHSVKPPERRREDEELRRRNASTISL